MSTETEIRRVVVEMVTLESESVTDSDPYQNGGFPINRYRLL